MTTVQYSLKTVNQELVELQAQFIRAKNKVNSCVQGSTEFWQAVARVRDIEKSIIAFNDAMNTLGVKRVW